jgi:hypothetical protein
VEYLPRWRMLLAGDKVTHSGDPISVIARSLGYESEAAFSTTLKRVEPSLHKAPVVQQGTAGSGKIIRHKSANSGYSSGTLNFLHRGHWNDLRGTEELRRNRTAA